MGGLLRSLAGFQSVSFAAPIRQFIADITGIDLRDLIDSDLKEKPIPLLGNRSPRYMMQTLGTEWGRQMVDTDLWVKVAMAKAHRLIADGGRAVVTDVRFENEADAIREAGGVIWHVSRPGIAAVASHVSEAGVPFTEGDQRIANDGTHEDLANRIVALLAG